MVTTLVNELDAAPGEVWLVLDDYHLVDNPEVSRDMSVLLTHLPPHVHVVLSTRADPDLPLARWRVRGELVEIRAADLRFTVDEAAEYLTEVTGLHLTAGDVDALEERTEGWIAALQLAALSIQGATTSAGSSPGSPGPTAISSTTWSRRSWRTSPSPCASSCCARRSSTGSPGHSATPSSAVTPVATCSRPGAGQPVRRPPGRPAGVVPFPPPLRRRAACTPARRAA